MLDAAGFFERWLPDTFDRLSATHPAGSIADCSVLARVGQRAWSLDVEGGRLLVSAGRADRPHTFAVQMSDEAFTAVLLPTLDLVERPSASTKLLRLDAESCRLVSNVPGALSVRVSDEHATHELCFGPGHADLAAPRCTVSCSQRDLADVRAGKAHPMDLFVSGKLALEGDIEIAMVLGGLLL